MKDLEPGVYRQRLVIEGHYGIEFDGDLVKEYLSELSKVLEMRIFSGPFCWPPDEWNHPEVKLYDWNGFVAWTESGCHVYAFPKYKFFTADIYSCKPFENNKVVKFTKDFIKSDDLVFKII